MLGARVQTSVADAPPLQRMRAITTVLTVVACAVPAVTVLVANAEPWPHALLLAPSLLASLWVASRWHTASRLPVLIPLLVLGAVTWAAAALLGVSPLAVLGLAVTGAIALTTHRVNRGQAAVLLTGLVAAIGLLSLLTHSGQVRDYTLSPALYTAAVIAIFWANDFVWRMFIELDAMRRTEAELAVTRERFRFASDLHDIQGHTLHVIKLKAAVAARLQFTDPERTAAELVEIQRLTAETIEQARELANSTHRLSFGSELANACNLLEAAGIGVTVDGQEGVPVRDDAVFALVMREATTNILRHSQARTVRIGVTAEQLSISNDGATAPAKAPRGLGALKVRVANAGGVLEHSRDEGNFTVRVRFGA